MAKKKKISKEQKATNQAAKEARRNQLIEGSNVVRNRDVDAMNKTLGPDNMAFGDALARQFGFVEGGLGRQVRSDADAANAQNSLSRYESIANQYGQRSSDTADYLGRMKSGLDGYTSEENQALREQGRRESDRDYQTAQQQQARAGVRSGVRGASAAAQARNLNTAYMQQGRNSEQDLLVKNIDEKRSRLDAYGNAIRGAETDEYGRRIESTAMLDKARQTEATGNADRDKFNLGQLAAERAGYASTFLGGVDMGNAQKFQGQADKRAEEMMQAARQSRRSGRTQDLGEIYASIAQLYSGGK